MATEIKVPVRLEVLQDSISAIKSTLANLKPDSSGWRALNTILQNMTKEADKLQIAMSKPFTNQAQFNAAEKSIEKMEEGLDKARLAMSRIKFSDIKLTPEQTNAFDALKTELKAIEQEIKQFKVNAKATLQESQIWDDIIKIDPNAATRTFDDLLKIIRRKNSELQSIMQNAELALNKFNADQTKRDATQDLIDGKKFKDLLGDQYSKYFKVNDYFKNEDTKNEFFTWVKDNFVLNDEQIAQLKAASGPKLDEVVQNMKNDLKARLDELKLEGQTRETNYQQATTNADAASRAAAAMGQAVDDLATKQATLKDRQDQVVTSTHNLEDALMQGARANESFDNSTRQMESQLENLKSTLVSTNSQFLQMQRTQQSFNQMKMAVVNFMGFNQVLNLTKQAIRNAINHIQELDSVMNKISIVTDMSTGDLWNQVDAYSKMAQAYGVSIKGAYEVSQIYYQQGLETKDVLTLTNETLKLAKISGLDYATTTDYMTTALRGFKMEMSDAATVVDVYSNLAAHTAVSQEELAVAMSKTASSMESVGATFEESSAMIATMVAVTRESATNIGSAMKSIASRYGELTKDPTKLVDEDGEAMAFNKVDAALQSVGISMKTVDGQFREFTDVIVELGEKWDQLDSTQQRYIATQFAGNRQQSRFLALVSNVDLLKSNLNYAENAEDTGTLQALKALDSIESKTEQVRVAYQQFYTTIGAENVWKGFLDNTKNVINTLNGLPKLFDKIPLGAIAAIANVITLIKALLTRGIQGIASIWTNAISKTTADMSNQGQATGRNYMQSLETAIKAGTPAIQAAVKAALSLENTNGIQMNQHQQALFKVGTGENIQNYEGLAKRYYDNGMMSEQLYKDAVATGNYKNAIEQANQAIRENNGLLRINTQEHIQNSSGTDQNTQSKVGFFTKLQDGSSTLSRSLNGVAMGLTTLGLLLNKDAEAGRIASGVFTGLGGALQTSLAAIRVFNGDMSVLPQLIMGVMNIINGLGIAIETPAEKLERLTQEAKELNNQAKEVKANYNTLNNSIKKLDELKEKRYESAEAAEEYQSAVDNLTDSFPELIAGFTDTNEIIYDAVHAEELLAQAREKSAKASYEAALGELNARKEKLNQANIADNQIDTTQFIVSPDLKPSETKPLFSSVMERTYSDSTQWAYNFISEYGSEYGISVDHVDTLQHDAEYSKRELSELMYQFVESAKEWSDENFSWLFNDDFITEGLSIYGEDVSIIDLDKVYEYINDLEQLKELNNEAVNQINEITDSSKSVIELDNLIKEFNRSTDLYSKNTIQLKIREIYNNLTDSVKENYPTLITQLDNFVLEYSNYAELIDSVASQMVTTIGLWQSYTLNSDKIFSYINDSSQLISLVNHSLEKIVKDQYLNNWDVAVEAFSKETPEIITNVEAFWSSLILESDKQLLNTMLSNPRKYSAQDIINQFSIPNILAKELEDDLSQLKTNAENTVKQLLNKNNITDNDIQIGFLEQTDTTLETDLLGIIFKQYQNYINRGLEELANKYLIEANKVYIDLQSISDVQTKINALTTLFTNGVTKEGLIKTQDAFSSDKILKNVNLNDWIKQSLLNVNLTLTSLYSNLESTWKEVNESFIKSISGGIEGNEIDSLIDAAAAVNIKLTYDDFTRQGTKFILATEQWTKYQTATNTELESELENSFNALTAAQNAITGASQITKEMLAEFGLDYTKYLTDSGEFDSNLSIDDLSEAVQTGWNNFWKIMTLYQHRTEEQAESLLKSGNFSSILNTIDKTTGKIISSTNEEKFQKLLELATTESYTDEQLRDGNLVSTVKGLQDSLYQFLQDIINNGIDAIDLNDYDYLKNNININDLKSLSLQQIVQRYSNSLGKNIEEINELIMQAIEKDQNLDMVSEIQSLSSAKIGDTLNLTKFYNAYLSKLEENEADDLSDIFAKLGMTFSNGLGKLEKDAKIPQIIQQIIRIARDKELLLESEIAELGDVLIEFLQTLNDIIGKGIEGVLSNAEMNQLQDFGESYGINVDFTRTADGFKLTQNSAIALYQTMKSIDALSARVTFNKLKESLIASNENYMDISANMARIKELSEAINNADKNVSTARLEEYQAELAVAQEILEVRSTSEDEAFDFMNGKIPGAQNNPLKYAESWGKAWKTLSDSVDPDKNGGHYGMIGYQDFYNMVTEMNNIAALGGEIWVGAYKLDGSLQSAAKLIEDGARALTAVDSGEMLVNLPEIGIDFAEASVSMGAGIDEGIHALAESQVSMLDGLIQLLETIVAMEKIGDVEADGALGFTIGDIFAGIDEAVKAGLDSSQIGEFTAFTKEYSDACADILKMAETNEDLAKGLKNTKVKGHSLEELLMAASSQTENQAQAFKDLNMSMDQYYAIIQGFVEAAKNGDYDLDNISESTWDIIEAAFTEPVTIDVGDKSIVISGGTHISINWNSANTKEALDLLMAAGKEDIDAAKQALITGMESYLGGDGVADEVTFEAVLLANGKLVIRQGENGKTEVVTPSGNKWGTKEASEEIARDTLNSLGAEFNKERSTETTVSGDYKVGLKSVQVDVDTKTGAKEWSYTINGKTVKGKNEQELKDAIWDEQFKQKDENGNALWGTDKNDKRRQQLAYETEMELEHDINFTVSQSTPRLLKTAVGKSIPELTNEVQAALNDQLNGQEIEANQTYDIELYGMKFNITTDKNGIINEADINNLEASIQQQLGLLGLDEVISKGIIKAFSGDSGISIGKAISDGLTASLKNEGELEAEAPEVKLKTPKVIIDLSGADTETAGTIDPIEADQVIINVKHVQPNLVDAEGGEVTSIEVQGKITGYDTEGITIEPQPETHGKITGYDPGDAKIETQPETRGKVTGYDGGDSPIDKQPETTGKVTGYDTGEAEINEKPETTGKVTGYTSNGATPPASPDVEAQISGYKPAEKGPESPSVEVGITGYAKTADTKEPEAPDPIIADITLQTETAEQQLDAWIAEQSNKTIDITTTTTSGAEGKSSEPEEEVNIWDLTSTQQSEGQQNKDLENILLSAPKQQQSKMQQKKEFEDLRQRNQQSEEPLVITSNSGTTQEETQPTSFWDALINAIFGNGNEDKINVPDNNNNNNLTNDFIDSTQWEWATSPEGKQYLKEYGKSNVLAKDGGDTQGYARMIELAYQQYLQEQETPVVEVEAQVKDVDTTKVDGKESTEVNGIVKEDNITVEESKREEDIPTTEVTGELDTEALQEEFSEQSYQVPVSTEVSGTQINTTQEVTFETNTSELENEEVVIEGQIVFNEEEANSQIEALKENAETESTMPVNADTSAGQSKVTSFRATINSTSGTVKIKADDTAARQTLSDLQSAINNAKGTVTISAQRGSEAKGNVALAGGRGTLMGELGPELVVSNGRYFIAGRGGAEFVDLDPDAIVFNHLQTAALLNNGKSSRGKPITNDRTAVSWAKGNINGGPAMASASAALAALRQLRAQWQALAEMSVQDLASKGGGGGGGGGGSDPKAFTKELEKWYDWLQQIAQLEKEITLEEAKRTEYQSNMIAKGKEYYASQIRTLDALQEQMTVQKSLNDSQQAYFNKRRQELNTQSAFSALYGFGESGQLYYQKDKTFRDGMTAFEWLSDLAGRDAVTGEANYTAEQQYQKLVAAGFGFAMEYDAEGNPIDKEQDNWYNTAIQAFWDKIEADKEEMQSLHDALEDGQKALLDAANQQNEILKEIQDNQIAVEDKVLKAIEDIRQQEIDNLKDEKDAMDKSSKELIDGLSEQLDKEQKMYQRQQESGELTKLQRQLSILQRSGGSAAQIASLQKDISAKQQDAYFEAQQDQIDALQEASDNQLEKLQKQIDLMTESLAFEKEHGLLWQKVYEVMQRSPEEITQFIMDNTKEYWGESPTKLAQDTTKVLFEAQQFTEFRDSVEGGIDALLEHYGIERKKEPEQKEEEITSTTSTSTSTSASTRPQGKQASDADIEKIRKRAIRDATAKGEETAAQKFKEHQQAIEDAKKATSKTFEVETYDAQGKKSVNKFKTQGAADAFISAASGTGGYTVISDSDKQQNGNGLTDTIIRKYSKGGMVDKDQLAFVHAKESVLTAEQTSTLRNEILSNKPSSALSVLTSLRDMWTSAQNTSTISHTNDTSIIIEHASVEMNVQRMANDYDAQRAGEQALDKIVQIARKTQAQNRIGR